LYDPHEKTMNLTQLLRRSGFGVNEAKKILGSVGEDERDVKTAGKKPVRGAWVKFDTALRVLNEHKLGWLVEAVLQARKECFDGLDTAGPEQPGVAGSSNQGA
jgi:hypothetical protein